MFTKYFADVVKFVIADMDNAFHGGGNKVFEGHISTLNRYLVPYARRKHVWNIGCDDFNASGAWRVAEMKREPEVSVIDTHDSDLNHAFTEAVANGESRSHLAVQVDQAPDN